jgi:hypothetical protein
MLKREEIIESRNNSFYTLIRLHVPSWFDFFMMFGNSYNYELIKALEIK